MRSTTKTLDSHNFFVYSPKDELLKRDFQDQFQCVENAACLGDVKFVPVNDVCWFEWDTERLIDATSSIICLISYSFVQSKFGSGYLLRKLVEADRLAKLKLIPVFYDHCSVEANPICKLKKLKSNIKPFKDIYGDHFKDQLCSVSKEIRRLVEDAAKKQLDMEESWKEALLENSTEYYNEFIKQFPHSKYISKAKANRDELVELKLWKATEKAENVEPYVEYLMKSVQKKHFEEALSKTIEWESNTEQIQKEAFEQGHPALLIELKNQMEEKSKTKEIDEKLSGLLKDNSLKKGPLKAFQTDRHWIKWKIYEHCAPEEIFSFSAYERFVQQLSFKQEKLKKDLTGKMVFPLFMLAIIVFTVVFYLVFEKPFAPQSDLSWGWLTLSAFVITLLIFCIYLVIDDNMKDQKKLEAKKEEAKKKWIELKIAILAKASYEELLLHFHQLEEWISTVKNKNLSQILFDNEEEQ